MEHEDVVDTPSGRMLVKSSRRDPRLRWVEIGYYLSYIPPEFWAVFKSNPFPFQLPHMDKMPHRYRFSTPTNDINAIPSQHPFTPATFFSYVKNFRWSEELGAIVSAQSNKKMCVSEGFKSFKAAFLVLTTQGRQFTSATDLIAAVESHTNYSFLDDSLFAKHLLYHYKLPDPSYFGSLDKSWHEDD
ncbi:hypothetical protein V5O48_013523 [Marasmius crinis-equi]|uniref:Uncharacterized protein n=1 Tax=Marasmius crinis-equi TaxID=585013 RepID=A0ABR3F083_9AGAR